MSTPPNNCRNLLGVLFVSCVLVPPSVSLLPAAFTHHRYPERKLSISMITSSTNVHPPSKHKIATRQSLRQENNDETFNKTGETFNKMASVDEAKEDGTNKTFIDSILTAIGSSTSTVVSLTFFAVLAYRRDTLMVSFFIGSIANGIASKVLKRVLNQDRPDELHEADEIKLKPSDKGMPSSHAMSLGFICTFTAMTLPVTAFPLLLYVTLSLYYRVKVNLHTKEQVYVGLVAGVTNGVVWKMLTSGTCPLLPSVNIMQVVSTHLLPPNGVLPLQYLLIPAVVGAAVVGSFERRISIFLSRIKAGEEDGKVNQNPST